MQNSGRDTFIMFANGPAAGFSKRYRTQHRQAPVTLARKLSRRALRERIE
jgi:hypothetical protein